MFHSLRDDHELLEGQATTGVGTAVEDVHEGHGQDIWLLGSGQVGDVGVQGNTLLRGTSLGDGQADTQDGIGTEVGLVGGAVELDEELVDLGLVLDVDVLLDEGRSNDLVDVLDGLEDTCRAILVSPVLPQRPLPVVCGVLLSPFPSHLDLSPSRSSHASC